MGYAERYQESGGTLVLKPAHNDSNFITCASDDDMPELMRYVVGYLTTMK